jgi:hypothetical protein
MRHRQECCAVAASHQMRCTKNEHIIRPCKLSRFTHSDAWKSRAALATRAGDWDIMQVCHLHMQKSHLRKNARPLVLRANQTIAAARPRGESAENKIARNL